MWTSVQASVFSATQPRRLCTGTSPWEHQTCKSHDKKLLSQSTPAGHPWLESSRYTSPPATRTGRSHCEQTSLGRGLTRRNRAVCRVDTACSSRLRSMVMLMAQDNGNGCSVLASVWQLAPSAPRRDARAVYGKVLREHLVIRICIVVRRSSCAHRVVGHLPALLQSRGSPLGSCACGPTARGSTSTTWPSPP